MIKHAKEEIGLALWLYQTPAHKTDGFWFADTWCISGLSQFRPFPDNWRVL